VIFATWLIAGHVTGSNQLVGEGRVVVSVAGEIIGVLMDRTAFSII
jgi:hypothetical protein